MCVKSFLIWIQYFPWICVVFFTAVKNCFTSDENTLSKKKDISCPTTSQANCSVNRMICSRFLSDYLEIFSAAPRKSLDNHSKTSHRSSCFPHSFFEVVEHENYYFPWTPVRVLCWFEQSLFCVSYKLQDGLGMVVLKLSHLTWADRKPVDRMKNQLIGQFQNNHAFCSKLKQKQ